MDTNYLKQFEGKFVSVIYDNTQLCFGGKVENYLGFIQIIEPNHISILPSRGSKLKQIILHTDFIRSVWVYKEGEWDNDRQEYADKILNNYLQYEEKVRNDIPEWGKEACKYFQKKDFEFNQKKFPILVSVLKDRIIENKVYLFNNFLEYVGNSLQNKKKIEKLIDYFLKLQNDK